MLLECSLVRECLGNFLVWVFFGFLGLICFVLCVCLVI